MKRINILIIDDVIDDAELVALQLRADKINFSWKYIDSEKNLIDALENNKWDAVISDYSMPGFDGISALRIVKDKNEDIPFIMVSGTVGEDIAVDAMKQGAQDYLMKGKMKRLGQALLREVKEAELRIKNKKIKSALDKSTAEMQSIFKTSPVGIGIIVENRKLQYANKKISEITGYSQEEIFGKSSRIYYPDNEEFERVGKIAYAEVEKKGFASLESKMKRKDGKKITVQINISRIDKNDNGKAYVYTLDDITERKKHEKIKSIIYNISNAVPTSKDLQELMELIRIQLGKIVDTTNFFVALYDEKNDIIELPYYTDEKDDYKSFPAGKTMTAYVIKTQKSILAKRDFVDELERKGIVETIGKNSKIWLGVPLKIHDKVTGVLVLQSYDDENAYTEDDINILEMISQQVSRSIENKKAEEDIKLALIKAKESDELKSVFLSTISHELRTPLNAIIGFSEIIDDETPVKETIDFVNMINQSAHNLFEIIEDILEITDIESGRNKIEKSEFEILGLMSSIEPEIETLKEKELKTHLKVKTNFPAKAEESKIFTNPSKFIKVFTHFLRNAIKFTEEGVIEYGFWPEKDQMIFFVRDTGIGIPKDKQDFIFDRFRQVEETHTRRYGGMGIGLSVVKKIINILGGMVWFDSIPGRGSTFYFSLPAVAKDKLPKTEVKDAEIVLDGKTLLVVEDEESNFILLEKILSLKNVNTIRAVNGKDAISKFREHEGKIDLIIMDMKMPVMNGYEASNIITKESNIPIIALSAYTSDNDKERAIECGCVEFIEKPVNRSQFLEKISLCLISE